MPFISLAAHTYDPVGAVVLECLPDVTRGADRRRVSRVATLDGGAAFNDFGFSEADRSIEIRWLPADTAADAVVSRLVQLHRWVSVSMAGAVYLAAPEIYTPGATESTLTLLVSQKLTED